MGECRNPAGNLVTGQNTPETCNHTWTWLTPPACTGPSGIIPGINNQQDCLANGLIEGEEYAWQPGTAQCINTQNQSVIPGLTSQEQCEGPHEWVPAQYSEGTPGFFDTLSAAQSMVGLASRSSAVIAGGHMGYNWQRGNFVFGVEGDITGFSRGTDEVSASAFADLSGIENFGTSLLTDVRGSARVDWLSTFRARAGMVVADDFLPFVTGGLAVGTISIDGTARFSGNYGLGGSLEPFSQTVGFSESKTKAGYAIGAGLDYRLSDRMFLNFTYLFVDLGKVSSSASFSGARSENGNSSSVSGAGGIDVDARLNIFRFGVTIKF